MCINEQANDEEAIGSGKMLIEALARPRVTAMNLASSVENSWSERHGFPWRG